MSLDTIIRHNSTEVNAVMSIWVWPEQVTSWQYELAAFDFHSLVITRNWIFIYLSIQGQWKSAVSLSPSINLRFCYRFSFLRLRKFKHRRIFRSCRSYAPAPPCVWNSSTCCQVGFPERKCVFYAHTCVTLNCFCSQRWWDLHMGLEMTDCWWEFV